MKTPLFISHSSSALTNWLAAFPDADVRVAGSETADADTPPLVFLNVDRFTGDHKQTVAAETIARADKVIVLSPTPSIDDAVTMIKMGASGYGHTHTNPSMLREMALVVEHGGLWVGSALLKRVVAALARPDLKPSSGGRHSRWVLDSSLSEREARVCRCVATGATNQEISATLGIAERTVKAHISSAFSKLHVRNRVELALRLNGIAVASPESRHFLNSTAL